MCSNLKTTENRTVSGYKVAIKNNGRYYSPATFIMYRKGKVPGVPKLSQKRIDTLLSFHSPFRSVGILNRLGFFYESKMIGRTAVFKHLNDAKKLMNSDLSGMEHVAIIKITGQSDMTGTYEGDVDLIHTIENINVLPNGCFD